MTCDRRGAGGQSADDRGPNVGGDDGPFGQDRLREQRVVPTIALDRCLGPAREADFRGDELAGADVLESSLSPLQHAGQLIPG